MKRYIHKSDLNKLNFFYGFWVKDTDLWFARLELQFDIYLITQDDEKFSFVVDLLGSEEKKLFENIIINPPAENKYETIKREILQKFPTLQTRLLDRKPSELLKQLRILFSVNGKRKECLQCTWLHMLPVRIKKYTAPRKSVNLADLAQRIDEIIIILEQTKKESICYINNVDILKKLVKLSIEMAVIDKSKKLPNPIQYGASCCWYHFCYGQQANKYLETPNFEATFFSLLHLFFTFSHFLLLLFFLCYYYLTYVSAFLVNAFITSIQIFVWFVHNVGCMRAV